MNVSKPNPRAIKEDDFPTIGTTEEQLLFLLNYAVLAPSLHNSQPWLFKVSDQCLEIMLNQSIALSIVDPNNRELIISCGAALGNLEVAARYFGYDTKVQHAKNKDGANYLAKISLSKGASPSVLEIALFNAITLRQTHRSLFNAEKASDDLLQNCAIAASARGVEFSYISDAKTKSEVAKLTIVADKEQFSRPWFRVELAAWMHSSKKSRQDGMSARRFGIPDILTPFTGFLIRTFNLGKQVASKNQKKIASDSSVLGIFSTQTDHPSDWLNSGRALSHVLLLLTAKGFSAGYLNQPIEVEVFRNLLRRVLATLTYPQIMLRIGKAPAINFSIRRSVKDCLVD